MSSNPDEYEETIIRNAIEHFKNVGEAEVNEKRDAQGRYAIHVAAGGGNNLQEVERLLSFGADIHSKDKFNNTPLHEAAKFNRNDSHFDVIKIILELGAEVNSQNEGGKTPLHFLTIGSNVKTIQLLLSFGADVNIKDSKDNTPFSLAISLGYEINFEVYKLLLDYGTDVNNLNNENMTPLHCACAWRNFKLVKFLVKNGANLNSLNYNGRTPLVMILRSFYHSDEVKFMIKCSDVNTIDHSEKNVLCSYLNEVSRIYWVLILQHVAKLQALDLPIHQKLHETISNQPAYQEYFEKCNEELKETKSTKIKNCWVFYFNLLLDSKRKLKNYAGNQDLVQDFKNSYCLNKFPIFGSEMIKRVDKGIKVRKSFDKSTVELSCCLPIFNPTHLIIKDVLDRLTFKDYNLLISQV